MNTPRRVLVFAALALLAVGLQYLAYVYPWHANTSSFFAPRYPDNLAQLAGPYTDATQFTQLLSFSPGLPREVRLPIAMTHPGACAFQYSVEDTALAKELCRGEGRVEVPATGVAEMVMEIPEAVPNLGLGLWRLRFTVQPAAERGGAEFFLFSDKLTAPEVTATVDGAPVAPFTQIVICRRDQTVFQKTLAGKTAPLPMLRVARPAALVAIVLLNLCLLALIYTWSWRRTVPVRLVGLCLAALLLVNIFRTFNLIDDAFISFRYARNLVQGHGLVFNLGERVEGFTNLLWVLIAAAGMVVKIPPVALSVGISIAATFALLYGVRVFCRRVLGTGEALALIAVAFLALSNTFARFASTGMETRFFTFLVFTGVLAHGLEWRRGDPGFPWSAVLLGLSAAVRPEGGLFVALVSLFSIIRTLAQRGAWRPVLIWLLVGWGLVAAPYVFRLLYYHELFPNPFWAKLSFLPYYQMGVLYVLLFFLEYGPLLPLIFGAYIVLALQQKEAYPRLLLVATVGAVILYLKRIGGDHFEFRMMDTLLPFMAVILADAVQLALQAASARGARGAIIAVGVGCLAWVALYPNLAIDDEPYTPPNEVRFHRYVRGVPVLREYCQAHGIMAHELMRNMGANRIVAHQVWVAQKYALARRFAELYRRGVLVADDKVVFGGMGVVPYYTPCRFFDLLGLVSKQVARIPGYEHYLVAHEKKRDDLVYRAAAREGAIEARFVKHPAVTARDLGDLRAALKVFERGLAYERRKMAVLGFSAPGLEYAMVFAGDEAQMNALRRRLESKGTVLEEPAAAAAALAPGP